MILQKIISWEVGLHSFNLFSSFDCLQIFLLAQLLAQDKTAVPAFSPKFLW